MSQQKPYKILHIFSSYGGGIGSLILNLIENKSSDFRFDIMAFSYKNGEAFLERVRRMDGKVYEMPRPRIDGYRCFRKFIDNVLAAEAYDGIHCHITGCHAKPFMDVARKHGIKNVILHAHTTRYDSRIDRMLPVQVYDRWLNYRRSSAYMTCSDLAAEYIFGKKYLKKRSAYLIPNGIDETLFSRGISREERTTYQQEFFVPEGAFVIGHIGRFSVPKNHDFVIDVVKELKKKGFPFVLIFVGDGERLEPITRRVAAEGLQEDIRFLGRRLDVASLTRYFDCMLLPSFNEGLPTVAMECQASGTPLLLSDRITRQCDMGLGLTQFLPIEDPATWANAIERTLPREHLDSRECLERIMGLGFTGKEAGRRYCGTLKELIGKNG